MTNDSNFLAELTNILKDSKNFALEQAPDVIKQIIRYEIISDGMYLIIALGLCAIAYALHKFIQKCEDSDAYVLYVPVAALVLAGIIMFCDAAFCLVQVIVTPKVFLLDYAHHLISSCSK